MNVIWYNMKEVHITSTFLCTLQLRLIVHCTLTSVFEKIHHGAIIVKQISCKDKTFFNNMSVEASDTCLTSLPKCNRFLFNEFYSSSPSY